MVQNVCCIICLMITLMIIIVVQSYHEHSNRLLLCIDSMSLLRGRDSSSHTALIQTNLNGNYAGQVLSLSKDERQQALPSVAALRVKNTNTFIELLLQEEQDDDRDAKSKNSNIMKILEACVQRFDPHGEDEKTIV